LAVCPAQIVGEFTAGVTAGSTVTVETAVPVQPELVPVTVYVVVATGEAFAVFVPEEVAPALHV